MGQTGSSGASDAIDEIAIELQRASEAEVRFRLTQAYAPQAHAIVAPRAKHTPPWEFKALLTVCTIIMILSLIRLGPAEATALWNAPVLYQFFTWTGLGPGLMHWSEPRYCPRETVCAIDWTSVSLLLVSRLTAYFMYFPMLLVLISKAHNLRTLLQRAFLCAYFPLSDLHGIHVFCGKMVFSLAIVHSIFHLVRWYHETETYGYYTDLCRALECGKLNATLRCYADIDCTEDTFGCNVEGIVGCRYCGSGAYENIVCPAESWWWGRSVWTSSTALTGYVGWSLTFPIVLLMWFPPEKKPTGAGAARRIFLRLWRGVTMWTCLPRTWERVTRRSGEETLFHYACCPRVLKWDPLDASSLGKRSPLAKEWEVRKKMHTAFSVVWALFLTLHATKTLMVIIMGSALIIYLVDLSIGYFWRTYLAVNPEFALLDRGMQLKFQQPKGFSCDGSGYINICIPWISLSEWHAFSIFPHPTSKEHWCVHIDRNDSLSDQSWTAQLLKDRQAAVSKSWPNPQGDACEGLASKSGPIWIAGPYSSPYSSAVRYDSLILIASGVGITPALAQIHTHRMHRCTNLIWNTADRLQLQFYLNHFSFPKDAWSIILFKGDNLPRLLPTVELPRSVVIIKYKPYLDFDDVLLQLISGIIMSVETGCELLPEGKLRLTEKVRDGVNNAPDPEVVQAIDVSAANVYSMKKTGRAQLFLLNHPPTDRRKYFTGLVEYFLSQHGAGVMDTLFGVQDTVPIYEFTACLCRAIGDIFTIETLKEVLSHLQVLGAEDAPLVNVKTLREKAVRFDTCNAYYDDENRNQVQRVQSNMPTPSSIARRARLLIPGATGENVSVRGLLQRALTLSGRVPLQHPLASWQVLFCGSTTTGMDTAAEKICVREKVSFRTESFDW